MLDVVVRYGNPSLRDLLRHLQCHNTDLCLVVGMLVAQGQVVLYDELAPGESRVDIRVYPRRPMTDICSLCRVQKPIDVLYRVGSKMVCLDCQGRAMQVLRDRAEEEG